MNLSTVLKHNFEALALYMSISISNIIYIILLKHMISL